MSLQNHLQQQLERLNEMVTLLRSEQSLLGEGKIDGERLTELAQRKQALFAELEQSEISRRNAQQKLGYSMNREGAEQAAADTGCESVWQDLIATTEQVANLNVLNGQLIQHRLQHNQQMLNILRDAAGSSLYGPDGQSKKSIPRVNSKA